MSENALDLNDARFDFSTDSLIKDTLLQGLLARQKDDQRVPISFDEIVGGDSPKTPDNASRMERDLPSPDKGRGL